MEQFVSAIIAIVAGFRQMAEKAVKEKDGRLFVPASIDGETLGSLWLDPGLITSSNPSEPCYLSLEDGNRGHNTNGTMHSGYLILDVIARKLIDLVDRKGHSLLIGHAVHLSGHHIGMGLEANIRTLRMGMGLFVVKESTRPFDFYATMRCRCPCLCADAFWRIEDACQVAKDVNGKVVEITPASLQRLAAEARKK